MNTIKLKVYCKLRSIICPFDKIIKYIPSDGELLDVGSGYGTFCFFLLKERPKMKITGIERDKDRVNTANSRVAANSNPKFICGDIMNFSINKRFDVIICLDLIHHIHMKDHPGVLKKINKLLKDNGLLIVKDMDNKPYYKYFWNYVHDLIMTRSTKMYYVPKDEMIKMLKKNGFVIEYVNDIQNLLYAHYVVVCKRRV
jgi:2-polyprenyl-3-methyl-5-hydroxy-6-metoxy-1,4-benzoquinol methylase